MCAAHPARAHALLHNRIHSVSPLSYIPVTDSHPAVVPFLRSLSQVFFAGDLNYRLGGAEMPHEADPDLPFLKQLGAALDSFEPRTIAAFAREHDQLQKEIELGAAFAGFNAGTDMLTFPPTYKTVKIKEGKEASCTSPGAAEHPSRKSALLKRRQPDTPSSAAVSGERFEVFVDGSEGSTLSAAATLSRGAVPGDASESEAAHQGRALSAHVPPAVEVDGGGGALADEPPGATAGATAMQLDLKSKLESGHVPRAAELFDQKRIPSYTDRVLALSGPDFSARRVGHGSVMPLACISDHTPVWSTFEVDYYRPPTGQPTPSYRDLKLEVSKLQVELHWRRLHDKHGAASAWVHRWGKLLPSVGMPKLRVELVSELILGGSATLKKVKAHAANQQYDEKKSSTASLVDGPSRRASTFRPRPAEAVTAEWERDSVMARRHIRLGKAPATLAMHVSTWCGDQHVPLGSTRVNLNAALELLEKRPDKAVVASPRRDMRANDRPRWPAPAAPAPAAGAGNEESVSDDACLLPIDDVPLTWCGVECGRLKGYLRFYIPQSWVTMPARTPKREQSEQQP